MACGDVLSLEDLQTAKKHQIFEAEVITGKAGGVAGGASIDYATNPVTGQIQKTLPAVLRDAGFRPASFTFATGGTLAVGDSDVAVLWPISSGGDGQYYLWKGAYPKTIPASSSPTSTGGVSADGWLPLGDITLRGELASATGAQQIGRGSGTVDSALSAVESGVVEADNAAKLRSNTVETASSASTRNRSYVRMLQVLKSAAIAPGDPGIMQSFWIDPFKREIWVSWDNSVRDRQIIQRSTFSGDVLSTDVYTGANTVGHLDGFHVNSDGSIWCTDKFTNPSLIKIKNGSILDRLTYSVPIVSNSILGVDRSFQDRFIVTGSVLGGQQKIYTGLFSEAVAGVLQLTDTGISLPIDVDETTQGVAVLYDRVYLLVGGGDLFKSKFIYQYRLDDGSLVAKVPCNPDRLYADQIPSSNAGVIREPEGLNVIFENLNNEQTLNFYVGFCFGNTDFANATNVIFKSGQSVVRTHTPTLSAWPGRADGQEECRPITHHIIFDKKSNGWGVVNGSFDSMLSRQLALNIRAGGPSAKGIVFDLPWSYQVVIGCSITSTAGLLDNNGVTPFWVYNAGGSQSRFGQRINLYDKITDTYIDGDDNSILTGTKIFLTLTVVQ